MERQAAIVKPLTTMAENPDTGMLTMIALSGSCGGT